MIIIGQCYFKQNVHELTIVHQTVYSFSISICFICQIILYKFRRLLKRKLLVLDTTQTNRNNLSKQELQQCQLFLICEFEKWKVVLAIERQPVSTLLWIPKQNSCNHHQPDHVSNIPNNKIPISVSKNKRTWKTLIIITN